jgi:2-polyprenyl-6-hydroxyphenyl methylase/3-demethylubiquinone-9 3-methyltransferase
MAEKQAGDERSRFGFGENWMLFSERVTQSRLDTAQRSLVEMLGRDSLRGTSFLDIGSGSGLFSLSAVMLGANPVHSVDYDPLSVETTCRLKDRFAPNAAWTVERADVLDSEHMASLGTWDFVYAWGVLHHTGGMWDAIAAACDRVTPGGKLFISIYNDQGGLSRAWWWVKRVYNALPRFLRPAYVVAVTLPMELRSLAGKTLRRRPRDYLATWRAEGGYDARGMSRWRDLVDWVGGYPFEVARPADVVEFCRARGLELRRLETVGRSHGCNEFLFEAPRSDRK